MFYPKAYVQVPTPSYALRIVTENRAITIHVYNLSKKGFRCTEINSLSLFYIISCHIREKKDKELFSSSKSLSLP